MAHKCPRWLHNPSRVGGPRRFRARGIIRGGPQVGKVLHNPCRQAGPRRFRAEGNIRGGPQVGMVAA